MYSFLRSKLLWCVFFIAMSVTKEEARSCRSESSGPGVADDILEDVGAGVVEGVVADDDSNPLITEDYVSEDVTALIDRMEERRVGGKSILVEPADLLSKEAQASAECSLSLVDEEEHVWRRPGHRAILYHLGHCEAEQRLLCLKGRSGSEETAVLASIELLRHES